MLWYGRSAGPRWQSILRGADILGTPAVFKIRQYEVPTSGYIHTDSKSKLVSVLIYFNAEWPAEGGRFSGGFSGNG